MPTRPNTYLPFSEQNSTSHLIEYQKILLSALALGCAAHRAIYRSWASPLASCLHQKLNLQNYHYLYHVHYQLLEHSFVMQLNFF